MLSFIYTTNKKAVCGLTDRTCTDRTRTRQIYLRGFRLWCENIEWYLWKNLSIRVGVRFYWVRQSVPTRVKKLIRHPTKKDKIGSMEEKLAPYLPVCLTMIFFHTFATFSQICLLNNVLEKGGKNYKFMLSGHHCS